MSVVKSQLTSLKVTFLSLFSEAVAFPYVDDWVVPKDWNCYRYQIPLSESINYELKVLSSVTDLRVRAAKNMMF